MENEMTLAEMVGCASFDALLLIANVMLLLGGVGFAGLMALCVIALWRKRRRRQRASKRIEEFGYDTGN